LQAFPFAIAHLGETYSSEILFFFVIVLLLGLGFGASAQKTNSLWRQFCFMLYWALSFFSGVLLAEQSVLSGELNIR